MENSSLGTSFPLKENVKGQAKQALKASVNQNQQNSISSNMNLL
jgi:hypothetical protein